jgi:hypothetical protein
MIVCCCIVLKFKQKWRDEVFVLSMFPLYRGERRGFDTVILSTCLYYVIHL